MKIKADNKLKDACKRFFEKALNENNVQMHRVTQKMKNTISVALFLSEIW